jgi:hypothetical protein
VDTPALNSLQNRQLGMEPAVGIEPTTFALRKHCSTAELRWLEGKGTLPAQGKIVKIVFAI